MNMLRPEGRLGLVWVIGSVSVVLWPLWVTVTASFGCPDMFLSIKKGEKWYAFLLVLIHQ